jgi:hypothetical protein
MTDLGTCAQICKCAYEIEGRNYMQKFVFNFIVLFCTYLSKVYVDSIRSSIGDVSTRRNVSSIRPLKL